METVKLEQEKRLPEKIKTQFPKAVGKSKDKRLGRQVRNAHHILAWH